MLKNIYRHRGVVCHILPDQIEVDVKRSSACDQCHASTACMTEQTSQKIKIPLQSQEAGHSLQIGDSVNVVIETQTANRAVIFAYVLPLIVFIGMFFLFLSITDHEGWSAVVAMALMSPYFFVLRLMRKHFQNTMKIYWEYA